MGEGFCLWLQTIRVPVVVKLRTGLREERPTAHQIIAHMREWGASGVVVGRKERERATEEVLAGRVGDLREEGGKGREL